MADSSPRESRSMSQIMDEYASLMSLSQDDYHSASASCAEMLAIVLAMAADQRDEPLARDIINLVVPAKKTDG